MVICVINDFEKSVFTRKRVNNYLVKTYAGSTEITEWCDRGRRENELWYFTNEVDMWTKQWKLTARRCKKSIRKCNFGHFYKIRILKEIESLRTQRLRGSHFHHKVKQHSVNGKQSPSLRFSFIFLPLTKFLKSILHVIYFWLIIS